MTEKQQDYGDKSKGDLLEIISAQERELVKLRDLKDKDLVKAYAEQGQELEALKRENAELRAAKNRLAQMLSVVSDVADGARAGLKSSMTLLNQVPLFNFEEPKPNV